ncbi:MAG: quinolinate synthase NadA [Alphaproteobacteria bacterium]|jgi:quinolinate synthase|nr:quinolinate synthase NadA [Alphaproteobacteria bacterium]
MAILSDALLTEAKTALPGQTGARILQEMDIAYSDGMARDMAPLYERVKSVIPSVEWPFFAPYIQAINDLKRERNAVILAHNYQTPEIFHGVADVVGDSLQLAIEAAKAEGDVIVQCGVHFMAETSKLLNPEKTVLIPDMGAGCSLADSITAKDVRALREAYPGVPIVTYVNTSAAVKAESDVCCTSSNAVKIVNGMGSDRVLCIPDEYLAQNIAREADVEVIAWKGRCEVHEQFTAEELQQYRTDDPGLRIIAHPECKPDVLDEADFSGSTSAMIKWVTDNQPDRVMMVTECSMSDNVAVENPNVNFVRPCNLCPHMKQITLPKILEALAFNRTEITVDAAISSKARAAVERMIELSR